MHIDRHALNAQPEGAPTRAFCPLECTTCRGLCLPVYMMLTRDEQEEMCRRNRVSPTGEVIGHC